MLADDIPCGPPPELTPGDPLAKRALHYLSRGRDVTDLDPPVLEALAGLDGALATDRNGRLLAFGAILRHDAASLPATDHRRRGPDHRRPRRQPLRTRPQGQRGRRRLLLPQRRPRLGPLTIRRRGRPSPQAGVGHPG